ncbi:MAG: hypothetical protein QM658_08855 [Gordonia sp. (in: high G+C Gram-positive bacteria)]
MRSKIAIGVGAVVFIGLLVAALLGAFTPKVDGTAAPDESTRLQKKLADIALSLAQAPGAKYTGTITGTGSYRLQVTGLTVTASGDSRGTVELRGETAQVMQIGPLTLVKAGSGFWDLQREDNQPKGIRVGSVADKWTIAPAGVFGLDLRAALRPQRLGLSTITQDTLIGGGDVVGDATGRGSETPDRRVPLGRDLTGIAVLDKDKSEDDKIDTRVRAGDMTVGADADGNLVSLRGPLGSGFASDQTDLSADLKVEIQDADKVSAFYSSLSGDVRSRSPYAAWQMTVPEPAGDLDCGGATCTLHYDVANTIPGATGGTVSMSLTGTMTGGATGLCTGSGTMPVNGSGTVRCTTPYSGGGDVNSRSTVSLTANATIDQTAVDDAASRGRSYGDAGQWTAVAPKAADAARKFNAQITGGPSGYVLRIGDVDFDGRESDGTLLLVDGPGYDAHVLADGSFDAGWAGTAQIVSQAKDAARAAGGKPVRMVFAEQRSGDAARALLAANQVTGVDVVVVPAVQPAS